jgi:hypothetical protein
MTTGSKPRIYIEEGNNSLRKDRYFSVKKIINSTRHRAGEVLNEKDVDALIDDAWYVEIVSV